MPIDFREVLNTVKEIQGLNNDLYRVVGIAAQGKAVVAGIGDIEFTQDMKDILTSKYQSIKSDMVDKFQLLP
jgi:hypothetical protein